MEYFLIWIGLALVVGLLGMDKRTGFAMAFFWALILSPAHYIMIS